MRPRTVPAHVLLALLAGCGAPSRSDESKLDTWLVKTVQDAAMKNAIISQQALFPYHFIPDSEELNELGKVDLGVLAEHYRIHPGALQVRRGRTAAVIYEARLKKVGDLLAEAGVPVDRVSIGDDLPGGDGMSSDRVLRILEGEDEGGSERSDPRRPTGTAARGGQRSGTGTGTTGGTSARTGGR